MVAATGPIEIGSGVGYVFDENGYMLTGEVELTDKDGKTGTYYLDTEGKILQKTDLVRCSRVSVKEKYLHRN